MRSVKAGASTRRHDSSPSIAPITIPLAVLSLKNCTITCAPTGYGSAFIVGRVTSSTPPLHK
jgi:hypothetical protein